MSVDGSNVYHGFYLRVIRDRAKGGTALTMRELYDSTTNFSASSAIKDLIDEGYLELELFEPKTDRTDARNIVRLTEKGLTALAKGQL